jgi:hypothetical protein
VKQTSRMPYVAWQYGHYSGDWSTIQARYDFIKRMYGFNLLLGRNSRTSTISTCACGIDTHRMRTSAMCTLPILVMHPIWHRCSRSRSPISYGHQRSGARVTYRRSTTTIRLLQLSDRLDGTGVGDGVRANSSQRRSRRVAPRARHPLAWTELAPAGHRVAEGLERQVASSMAVSRVVSHEPVRVASFTKTSCRSDSLRWTDGYRSQDRSIELELRTDQHEVEQQLRSTPDNNAAGPHRRRWNMGLFPSSQVRQKVASPAGRFELTRRNPFCKFS